jgi:hypothetical protein
MGYLHFVRSHIVKLFPEYAEIYSYRQKRNIPTSAVMAYAIPGVAAAMWAVLIALT